MCCNVCSYYVYIVDSVAREAADSRLPIDTELRATEQS